MSELTISISDKADALIAQLQKEIFNRRRKKVTKEKVVETLLESGAKSQSDKRFATSWQNLLADIERAARVAQTHGSKPSSLTDDEWALVLNHRTRATPAATSTRAIKPRAVKPRAKAKTDARATPVRRRKAATATVETAAAVIDQASAAPKARGTRAVAKARPARAAKAAASATTTAKPKAAAPARAASSRKRATATTASPKPEKVKATASRKAAAPAAKASRSSVARRMAKAASRLASAPIAALPSPAPAAGPVTGNGGNGVEFSAVATQLPS